MNPTKMQRVLISVSNKEGIVSFAKQLHALGMEIISTGGTSKLLREEQIPVVDVSDITGFPEMMDGRLKTLHPKIHGGILGRRSLDADIAKQHEITWIDLVVVNLYPFSDVIQQEKVSYSDAIENIDIGGPAMIRSAAKNMSDVAVVVDPDDYEAIINELSSNAGSISEKKRNELAIKAFEYTALYDSIIHNYLRTTLGADKPGFPEQIHLVLKKPMALRYGENPNQRACAYQFSERPQGIFSAAQQQGKTLSYNNLLDADAAIACVSEFDSPACVIVKHANPCGVASAAAISTAFSRALDTDKTSSFGGIIALNRACDEETATLVTAMFFEVLIAPSFSQEALAILAQKPNLRVLALPATTPTPGWEYKGIDGGMLVQDKNIEVVHPVAEQIVTLKKIGPDMFEQLCFAWRIVKHVKSNAILIAKDFQAIGIGAGQVSRIDAVDIAVNKAGRRIEQAVLASDAFFPFRDSIDRIAHTGITAIIQPGGSVRDQDVIDACNEHGIAMLMTGARCFKH